MFLQQELECFLQELSHGITHGVSGNVSTNTSMHTDHWAIMFNLFISNPYNNSRFPEATSSYKTQHTQMQHYALGKNKLKLPTLIGLILYQDRLC